MKKRYLLNYLFVLSMIGLVGCAPPAYVIDDAVSSGSLGSKTTVIVDDQRPESDKERSIGSLMVTSDDYGIWTLGDNQFQPPVLDVLKNSLLKRASTKSKPPKTVTIKLKRLIINANHQADLLQSVSRSQTPLAVAIAESMHGKKFEMDIDKTRPYAIGFIDTEVKLTYGSGKSYTKKLSLSKAENFSSHVDEAGRKKASIIVVRELMNEFAKSVIK